MLASLASGYSQLGTRTPISRQPAALQLPPLEERLALRLLRRASGRGNHLIASAVFLCFPRKRPSGSDTPRAALVPEGHTGIVPPKCCLSWDSASLTG